MRIGCIFLLVEAPAPNPGEQNMFWVTIPPASATRLKIVLEDGYNLAEIFGEVERVVISRLFHLAA